MMLSCIKHSVTGLFSLIMIPDPAADVYTVFLRKNNARMTQTTIPMT